MITLQSPGEILFSIGPITVYWYGLIIGLAFLAGLGVVMHVAKQENIDPDEIINLSIIGLIVGVLSARLYYVLFAGRLEEFFLIWQGGLSIHGVIIGGLLMMLVLKKKDLLKYTDIFAYGLILGQSIGRWGNFFNSEAYGSLTTLPLSVFIPGYGNCHPTFLYESVWNFLIFAVLFFIIRPKMGHIHGIITCSYLILYSLGRFFIEGLRLDNIYTILGLPIAQFISLGLIIAGVVGLIVLYFNYEKTNRHMGVS